MKIKHLFALLLLEGLTLTSLATAGEEQAFHGIAGRWLTNAVAEAFVSGTPCPRIVAFRLKGGESPLRISTTDPFFGVRVWFMEPAQNEQSPLPALRPATLELLPSAALRLTGSNEPVSGLQLTMEAALDPGLPVLRLRYGLKNLRVQRRRLAVWAIVALPHAGVGFAPWRAPGSGAASSMLAYPGSSPADPCVRVGEKGLGIDFRVFPGRGQIKIGTSSDAGWAGYGWSGHVLKSTADIVKGADYPEGGATITMYQCGKAASEGFCEIEHAGPLCDVGPGESAWMSHQLELRTGIKPATDSVDGWLDAVR
ncbi:MAG: hypothetical protein WCI17_05180 [bacterium]